MQIGFHFNEERCIGCYTCVAACRSWNELEQDIPDLIEIRESEQGEYPNISLSYLFFTCFHCATPSCTDVCPYDLVVKRAEDGVVVIDNPEQCTKCQLCVEACPYGAPKITTRGPKNIVKCNMCLDRLSEGRKPACVAACPTEALDVGPTQELIAKYGASSELEGFVDSHQVKPSIVFHARDSQQVS